MKNMPFGVGSSDGREELIEYFRKTNQKFLTKYEFATHNQYLDFLLKFGFLGFFGVIFFNGFFVYIALQSKNALMLSFCLLFFLSNFTDDFLIRFDGIAFSGFWFSIFAAYTLKNNNQLIYKKIDKVCCQ